MAQRRAPQATAWVGWAFFAAAMLLAVGSMQVIAGLVGIFNSDFYVKTAEALVAFNYTAWGWAHLLLGVLMIASGVGILSGAVWARIVAVVFVVLNMVENAAFLSVYPLWALTSLVLGAFVIYALTMHGSELDQ